MSKFNNLLESYNQQLSEQVPSASAPVPMPTVKGGSNMAVPMPTSKSNSGMAVPMPGLNQQKKPESQFKNTTPMERMKDLWDLLIATQTDDQATVKRILTKYGMTYMPKTTGP